MNPSKLRKTSGFLLLFAGVAALCNVSVADTYNLRSGVYCTNGGNAVMAEQIQKDGTLKVGFLVSYPDLGDATSSLYGAARKVGPHHWLYEQGMKSANPDDHCAVDITVNNDGWHFVTRKGGDCVSSRGFRARYADTPAFPLNSYMGRVTHQLDSAHNLQSIDCATVYVPAKKPAVKPQP